MTSSPSESVGVKSVIFTPGNVSAFLDLVDDVADQFYQQLDGATPKYLYESLQREIKPLYNKEGNSF